MIHLLIIAVFMVLFLRDMIARPYLGGAPAAWTAGVSLGLLAIAWGVAHLEIWRQGRRIDRDGQMRALRRADRASSLLRIGAVAIHAFNVLALGWLDVVRSIVGNIVAVDELLAVAPVLIVFAMSWWSMYPIERRLREAVMLRDLNEGHPARPIPSRFAFVLSPLRHHVAMVLVPISLIMMWSEVVEFGATRFSLPPWLPALGLQLAGMAVVLTMMPLVMRRVWDTAALGAGPLREQIAEMCRRHGVRVRELLVWRTQGTMINGAVMGIAGPLRYILLTDALLEHLHPRQIEAVTAHEIGHVRLRHMPWLMGGVLASIVLGSIGLQLGLYFAAGSWLHPEMIETASAAGALLVALVLFGFASRRFEWQADAFAAQHLSGCTRSRRNDVQITPEAVNAMSSALEAVARLNHIRRERFTWRHGSIASRQRRLHALVGHPAGGLKPDRDALVVKVVTGAGVLMSAGLIAFEVLTRTGG